MRRRQALPERATARKVVYVTGIKTPFAQGRAYEQKFRASFDQAYQGMHLLDLQGHVLELNRSALRALGQPRDAVSGVLARLEVQFALPGGRQRLADRSIKPFRDEHDVIRILIAEAREVTEQRERAAALVLSETRLQHIDVCTCKG
jgi:PAS domain-containing protein